MELTVLVVPACPHTGLLRARLDQALEHRQNVTVIWREITDPQEAERSGMHGSPTLLVNGINPFALPGQQPSLSCRLGDLPTVDQLRELFSGAGPA